MELKKKPNILFIVTDDQRYNTIHALGNEKISTPNMDELVHRGTSFLQAHIPGGTSGAVCMPSRAMINSGRTLFHLEGEGQNIPPEHKTLGETLKANGYHCFGTGKWHNGCPSFARSFSDGDNIFFGGMWDHWNVPVCYFDPTGEYDNVINFVMNFYHEHRPMKMHCDKFNPGKHSSELLSETVIKFIDEYQEEKPFFIYDAYLAPHDPRTMPEEFKNMYPPEKIKIPENFCEQHFEYGVTNLRDETLAPYPRTKEEVQRQLAEYYGMISHLDHEIGKIINKLKEKGLYDDTIIVLAGDNGLAMGCHGLFGKQNLYDHSIRVPLILSGPGIPVNETRNQYVYLLDIFPTLCEMLDIKIPDSVEGISFLPCIKDPEKKIRTELYLVYNEILRGMKDERYKYIEYRNHAERMQLFDLKEDPNEMHDLIHEPSMRPVIAHLQDLMLQYKDAWDDTSHRFGKEYWRDQA